MYLQGKEEEEGRFHSLQVMWAGGHAGLVPFCKVMMKGKVSDFKSNPFGVVFSNEDN